MASPQRGDPSAQARASEGAARPPSVERLLGRLRTRLDELRDADALTAAAREVIAAERARLNGDAGSDPASLDRLADAVLERLDGFVTAADGALRPAINATGVILHTNLGRAPWAEAAIEAASRAAAGYSILELDVRTGRRGPRFRVAEDHLVALTGSDDALVVNNNATAVALAVGLAGSRGGVAVSRGELVEIGGGVRIPEIIRRAGARLIEVGTTNRTRVDDFREPLASARARVVLRVHPSNFRQTGFVESPDPAALARLAHEHGAILVDDLGSGALLDTRRFGLAHEPTPGESLQAGADLVTFSGDKLVGGPQAGLIVGAAPLIARLRRDPLARATRPDKALVAALAATLGLYRAGLTGEIPVWRMIGASVDSLRGRAAAIVGTVCEAVPDAAVRGADMLATVGGGSLPGETLASGGLAIEAATAAGLLAALRGGSPPVIGRIEADLVLLDLRTVRPDDDATLASAIVRARHALSGNTVPGKSGARLR
jgi:L-seryl-tRNA(Ser) seleniumtransferase